MENKNNAQEINILQILRIFLSYWLLLVISTSIFLFAGLLYLKFSSKTYSVYARIGLSTERRSSGGSSAYVNINEMMNQQKSFTNEISFLRSSPQIKAAIKKMNLFTSYYIKQDKIPKELPFSFHNIYKNTPFIVLVDEKSPQPLYTLFYVKILDDDRFSINAHEDEAILYYFENESTSDYTPFSINGTYKFGETIQNKNCSFKILLNSNYNSDEYLGKDLFFRFHSPGSLTFHFQKSLSVKSAFYESSIADLTFEADNKDLGIDFLTNLINEYIAKNLEKKNYNANNTIDYIDRQLANISGSLGQSEQQLQNFQSSRDVMNISEKSSTLYSQLQGLEQNKNEVNTRFQYLSVLNDVLDSYKDNSAFIAPSMVGMSDATLATLIQELATLSSERQNLISTKQLRNPRIKTLDANIATIKKVISDNVFFSLSAARAELDEVNKRINKLNEEISSLPQTQRQLFGLQREFNINDAVYTSLLDKRFQAQIIKASNAPDCEIIEPVQYVEVTSPSPKIVGILALFLGIFLPSIYIVFVNFLTQNIRTKEELVRVCKLPSIGYIPHNDKNLSNVFSNFPQAPIAERFRSLRSSLIYYLFGETHKSILVTSTVPNEGKSFISLNLALSFASTDSKTLLIGFDLRKNSHTLDELKSESQIGLSSYLINKASLDDIILKTIYPNLDFIPNGQIPPDPVALLSRPRVKELFEILKAKYDYIIIDTPPFGLVTDAFLLMQYADVKLYVSRLGVITKKALKQSMEDLDSKKIENIYNVQNDMTNIDRAYALSYSYEDPNERKFPNPFKKNKKKKK